MPVLETLVDFLWGPWTPWFLFVIGVFFTVWTRFVQYNTLTHGISVVRGTYDRPDDPGAINHFQALSAALSGTVGLGNIGGVALAIGIGGPGALFWMWVVGFFGMALKTVEITLAMIYRNTEDPDNPHGGAMWVVDKALGSKGGIWKTFAKVIATFFCLTLINSALTGSSMFQSWNVANLTENYFGLPPVGSGVLMIILVGLVIIGGIKRIGQVTAQLVPLMCILYIVSAFVVLALHIEKLPSLLILVVKSAFNSAEPEGAFLGGTVGFAFMQGMKRALYSNEAGQGSAPIAHAAAKTSEPAREGIIGGIGPFIDTICICSLTAMVILATGTWNRNAIGQFGDDITLVRVTDTPDPIWRVTASHDVTKLPPLQQKEEWKRGSRFFVLANVVDAVHGETGANTIPVTGQIIEARIATNKNLGEQLRLKWKDLKLNESDWIGVPSGIVLENPEVYRHYGGAYLTAHAFDRQFPGLGKWLVTFASWLFAISTMITWAYYGEQGIIYIFGNRSVLTYKLFFLIAVFYGATGISGTGHILSIIDISTGAMLWANLPIVLALGHLAVRSLNEYLHRLKNGEFHRR